MRKFGKYIESDSMSELVDSNYRILLVMSRFGIKLGFGDRSIGEVCKDSVVDIETFLAIANMLVNNDLPAYNPDKEGLKSLLTYLHNSHNYFLSFRLPEIRSKLLDIVGTEEPLAIAIVNYFDGYISEVDRHMKYEEERVFPYVLGLLNSKPSKDGYSIEEFERQHDQIDESLREFKNIIIKYYPSESDNELNSVLFDIFNCEDDLILHTAVENHLFTPAVKKLENRKHSVK